jgi:hypothetical protein
MVSHPKYGKLVDLHDSHFDWKQFTHITNGTNPEIKYIPNIIPNIIHFIFGLKEQDEEFLFCYYLAIYSAYKVNNPDTIYFYHHYPIYGKWWDQLKKEVPILTIEKVDIPTHIGEKKIFKVAHMADKLRMDMLWKYGGVYMDIDTISIRPYKDMLKHDVVLGKQFSLRYRRYMKDNEPIVKAEAHIGGICNAVMLTKCKSDFFKIWMEKYEEAFDPTKWEEASIWLPYELSKDYPDLLTVVEPDVFFMPTYFETHKIFEELCNSIPRNLITLHLSETFGIKYIQQIQGWEWCIENKGTMYAKIMQLFYTNNKSNN